MITLRAVIIAFFLSSISFSFTLKDSLCNKNYIAGIEALNNNDTSTAEKKFNEAINECENVQSYLRLTQLYFSRGTFNCHDKAKALIERAIFKNPKNIDFHLLYAKLLERTGYFNNAIAELNRAFLIDSNDVRVCSTIGTLKAEEYNDYKNSYRTEQGLYDTFEQIDKTVAGNTSSSTIISGYGRLADESFNTAEFYLKKTISADSLNSETYYQLAFLYEDANKPGLAIPYFEKLVKRNLHNKNAHLYLALLYFKTGKIELSHTEYQKAIFLMKPEERDDFVYNSAKLLLDPTGTGKYDSLSAQDLRTTIDIYWKSRDPMFLTEYNERLLEHYSRITYANLRFGYKNIPGWKTDKGEAFVRYGEPLNKTRFRPQLNANGVIKTKTDVWNYGDIVLGFDDVSMDGKFRFSTENIGGTVGQFYGNTDQMMKYLRRNRPVSYLPKLGGPVISLVTDIVQFKEGNATNLLINYAVPLKKETTSNSAKQNGYKYGMFLFDGKMQEIFAFTDSVKNIDKSKLVTKIKDTLYIINSLSVVSQAIKCIYSFEVVRNEDKGVARDRNIISIRKYPVDSLAISGILLANKIETSLDEDAPVKGNNLSIYPNSLHYFTNDNPLFIYYEAYNLKKNKDNLCNFEQKLIIERIDNDKSAFAKAVNSVLGFIGLANNKDYLSLTSKYQVAEKDSPVYLQIDMSDYIPGNYSLKVVVKDTETGAESSSQTNIIWNK